ncbi:MAG: TRAP transporter substrate-binding protein DctP [Opitutaceae bacterium]
MKDKRLFLTGLVRFGLLSAGVLASALILSAADRQKVNLGTLAPRGSIYHQALQSMGEQWREAPGVEVLLNIHTDGRLGGEADMVRLMRNGTLQAGLFTAVGLSEIEPGVAGLQSFPMAFRDLAEVDYINEKLGPMLEERLAARGFVVLFWLDAGWVRYFSTVPLAGPEDMKRMKTFVWAGNPDQVDMMRKAGYKPVALETADIGSALRTGLIEVVPSPPIFALATQIYRPAPHMLELNWAPLVGAAIVRKDVWDGLAPEARDYLRSVAKESGLKIKARSRQESSEAVAAMQERGLVVHAVSPEMETQWRAAAEVLYPEIRGTLVPADIFDEVLRLLKDYREGSAIR